MQVRQRHSDGSLSEIAHIEYSWRLQVTIPRPDGSCLSLIGLQAATLDEAKSLAARALKKENRRHVCTGACKDWEEF